MNSGWIKLHRKLLNWEWYQKSEMVHLFLHFLLLANHEENQWQGKTIKRGQFITGLQSLSENTGISVQTLRTCINRLKSTGEITSISTNKFRLITIINWEQYQPKEDTPTSKLTSKLTNNQQSTNNQLTANKNIKNDKNEKKLITSELSSQGIDKILDIFYKINPTLNWGNKTTRKAAAELIKRFGLEGTIKMAEQIVAVQGEKFAPVATTPYQMKEKLAQFKIYFDSKKNNQRKITKL